MSPGARAKTAAKNTLKTTLGPAARLTEKNLATKPRPGVKRNVPFLTPGQGGRDCEARGRGRSGNGHSPGAPQRRFFSNSNQFPPIDHRREGGPCRLAQTDDRIRGFGLFGWQHV